MIMVPHKFLVLTIMCVMSLCCSQSTGDQEGLLTFTPPVLVLSQERSHGSVAISCTYPKAKGTINNQLKIQRRLKSKHGASFRLIAESNRFPTSHANFSQESPFNKTLKVSGNYRSTLVVVLNNATCIDTEFSYRCFSAYIVGNDEVKSRTAVGTFTTEHETPQPQIQFSPTSKSLDVGQQLTLTCKASIGLFNDPVKARWVWEYTDGLSNNNNGQTWSPVLGKNSSVNRGCVVVSSSVYTTRVHPQVPCSRRFRCYIIQGEKSFVDTAAIYQLTIVGCGNANTAGGPAIAVAFLGSLIFIIGVTVLTLSLIMRRRRRREEKREELGDNDDLDQETHTLPALSIEEQDRQRWRY